jgi:hypothetical protein
VYKIWTWNIFPNALLFCMLRPSVYAYIRLLSLCTHETAIEPLIRFSRSAMFSAIQHRAVKKSDVSEEHVSSTFTVKESSKKLARDR